MVWKTIAAFAFGGVALMSAPAWSADDWRAAGQRGYEATDPMIGTGGDGHTFPGATLPFGMVQLSPDTRIQQRKDGYGWAAGYNHRDSSIVGFSHTHFSGTGHSDLGDVLLIPQVGEVKTERGDPDKPGSGYTAHFSHASEVERSPADPQRVEALVEALSRAEKPLVLSGSGVIWSKFSASDGSSSWTMSPASTIARYSSRSASAQAKMCSSSVA